MTKSKAKIRNFITQSLRVRLNQQYAEIWSLCFARSAPVPLFVSSGSGAGFPWDKRISVGSQDAQFSSVESSTGQRQHKMLCPRRVVVAIS